MFDLIVVGGGIVGLAAAYQAICSGAKTLLIDRADPGRATAAGAGIIAPATAGESDAWVALALPAVADYPDLVARLQRDGADDTGYAPTSQLNVAVGPDEDQAYAALLARVRARQHTHGVPHADSMDEIDAAHAQSLFPALAPTRHAFVYRGAARVDGRVLAAALRHAALVRGVEVRTGAVARLALGTGRVDGVVVDGETIGAHATIIAGGAWSGQFAAQLGVAIPVKPSRGQIIHLGLPGVDTARWPIVNAFHGHYLVPWHDRRVVVGATRERGTGWGDHVTAAGVREVLDEALRVAPGLANATLLDIRVGIRPATPDRLPVLGAVPGVVGVFLAAGHGATGLQLGPYSGKLVADLALGRPLATDISAFSVARFAG